MDRSSKFYPEKYDSLNTIANILDDSKPGAEWLFYPFTGSDVTIALQYHEM